MNVGLSCNNVVLLKNFVRGPGSCSLLLCTDVIRNLIYVLQGVLVALHTHLHSASISDMPAMHYMYYCYDRDV